MTLRFPTAPKTPGFSRPGLFGGQTQDPNAIQSERVRRRMGGMFEQPPVDFQQPEQEPEEDIYTQTLRSLSKQGPAMERYGQHVLDTPTREAHQGGWMNRIAASLAGVSAGLKDPVAGVNAALAAREAPYRQALEEHALKGQGLGFQAEREESDRQNQLGLIKAIRDAELEERKVGATELTAGAAASQARSNQMYREAMAADLERKGWDFYDDDQGNRIAFKMGANGVPQKQNLGSSIKKTESDQAAQRIATSNRFAGAAEMTAEANRERAGQSFQLPNQQFYSKAMATRQAVSENPDWKGFVNPDGSIKTSVGIFGGDPRRYPGSGALGPDGMPLSGYQEFLNRVKAIEEEINRNNRVGIGFGNMFDDQIYNLDTGAGMPER